MGSYVDTTSLNTMMSNCNGDHLMLACKPSNDNFYTVLAHAPRASVLMEQALPYTPVVANGAGWYFDPSPNNDYGGLGFIQAGDPHSLNPCDIQETNSDTRLCWHTLSGSFGVGFRCGATLWLNEGQTWQRFILQRND